jgi:hypothetical protein
MASDFHFCCAFTNVTYGTYRVRPQKHPKKFTFKQVQSKIRSNATFLGEHLQWKHVDTLPVEAAEQEDVNDSVFCGLEELDAGDVKILAPKESKPAKRRRGDADDSDGDGDAESSEFASQDDEARLAKKMITVDAFAKSSSAPAKVAQAARKEPANAEVVKNDVIVAIEPPVESAESNADAAETTELKSNRNNRNNRRRRRQWLLQQQAAGVVQEPPPSTDVSAWSAMGLHRRVLDGIARLKFT